MAQLVEHILGKDEVPGPNPGSSSRQPQRSPSGALVFYKACALHKSGLSRDASLALGRVLRAKRAESGSHICDSRYLDTQCQYPGASSRQFRFCAVFVFTLGCRIFLFFCFFLLFFSDLRASLYTTHICRLIFMSTFY